LNGNKSLPEAAEEDPPCLACLPRCPYKTDMGQRHSSVLDESPRSGQPILCIMTTSNKDDERTRGQDS